jgi:hypothetical protein
MPVIPMSSRIAAWPFAWALCLCSILPQALRAAPPGGDACAMLTASQVSTVLGLAVSAGEHPIVSSLLLCSWAAPGKPQAAPKKVSISLMTERAFEVGKSPLGDVAVTPLVAVGDDAYYAAARSLGTRLSVKKGSVCVQIRVQGFAPGKAKALEKALALQMLTSTDAS